jgi:hypothetical protein
MVQLAYQKAPRNGRLWMSEPRGLVEHFFGHEFGRLGTMLTRLLSARRLICAGGICTSVEEPCSRGLRHKRGLKPAATAKRHSTWVNAL